MKKSMVYLMGAGTGLGAFMGMLPSKLSFIGLVIALIFGLLVFYQLKKENKKNKSSQSKSKKDVWGRDEYQVAQTGKIDTRGLYLAMGLLIVLMGLAALGIQWADTGTQMMFVFWVLLTHQVIEQALHSTDPYFVKMGLEGRKLLGSLCLIFGLLLFAVFLFGSFVQSPGIFRNNQISFTGLTLLMIAIFEISYALVIFYVTRRESKADD